MVMITLDRHALRGICTVRQKLHYDFFQPVILQRRPEDGIRTEAPVKKNDPLIIIPARNADFPETDPYNVHYHIRRKGSDKSVSRELRGGWAKFVIDNREFLRLGSDVEFTWHNQDYLLLIRIAAPPPQLPFTVVVPRKPRTRRERVDEDSAAAEALKAASAGAGAGAGAGGSSAVDDAGPVEQQEGYDTRLVLLNDPNDNHVSIKTANWLSKGSDLKSGDLINVWIDYKNEKKLVKIYMSYSNTKPTNPVLDVEIDLSENLKEFVYLGFSGSSEGSTEDHLIQSFGFQTFGFLPVRPHFRTHNVSDSTVTITTALRLESSSKNRRKRIGLSLVIAGPVFCCIVLVVLGFVFSKKWVKIRRQKSFKAEMVTGPREFSCRELKFATKGFHSSRILGNRAFGTVNKAYFLSSGVIAAVKRSKHYHENKAEFLAELSIIACLRHKNLVQLQGWCAEKGELLLVYDYMPNGSLDKVLYPETKIDNNLLPWPQRYNAVVGLASVLTYLHQECEQQVIHGDIKTSNVLLDGSFNPKLGDFGLARLMDHDKSSVSTLTAGTMGYLAPEYLRYGKATEKTDVFSFGVVVLEVACGRQPIERVIGDQNEVNLLDWVWGLHSQGRLLEAADPRLKREFDEAQMKKLLLVGLSCTNPDCLERPNMRRVLQILNNEASPVLVPKLKPTLIFSSSLPLSTEDLVSDYEV